METVVVTGVASGEGCGNILGNMAVRKNDEFAVTGVDAWWVQGFGRCVSCNVVKV